VRAIALSITSGSLQHSMYTCSKHIRQPTWWPFCWWHSDTDVTTFTGECMCGWGWHQTSVNGKTFTQKQHI